MTYIYNSPLNLNIPKIVFKSNEKVYLPVSNNFAKDNFTTNPANEIYDTKIQIEQNISNNPKLKKLLKENNVPANVNISELEKLKKGHLRDTRVVSAKIYSSLPNELKSQVNLPRLQQAAMLHDYGKVLIPTAILNKQSALDDNERKIIQLHSELGYELLRNKGLDEKTLTLVKYHHQVPDGTGYPMIQNDFEYDIESQILNIADKYTALREERCYKGVMSKDEALNIISEDVAKGNISPEVFDALRKSAD